MADLTRRLYTAAETGVTPEETTRAVCRELAARLEEAHALYGANLTSSRKGVRMPSPGDRAHLDVIAQLADHLGRVGDERMPS